MNKKLLLLLPAFAMAFSMAGCDRSSKNSSSETASTPTTSTTSQNPSNSSANPSSEATPSSEAAPSSENSSEQGSSETPVGKTYSYKLGDAAPVALTKKEGSLLPTQTGQYEAENVAVTAGQAVVFYEGDAAITENIGSDPEDTENKNNGVFNEGAISIHNDATANIYFKTWESGGFSYWITGYAGGAPIVSGDYKVVGTMNEWAYASGVEFADATKQEEVDADWYKTQLKAVFTVAADDEFKLFNGAEGWIGGDKLATNANFEVLATEGHEGNIKAKAAGSVDLYYKTFKDDSIGLAIVFTPSVLPDSEHVFTYKVDGGEALAFGTELKAIKGDNDAIIGIEYGIADKRIFTKDEVLTFFRDGVAINPGASGEGNNAVVESTTMKVRSTTAEAVSLYLKFYYDDEFNPGNPGYDVWLGGYVATTTQYTVTDVPAAWDNSADYYCWAWGGESGTGKKYDATLDGTSIKTTIPADDTHFLLVKVEKGESWDPASWDTHKLGQSRNITIEALVTSYQFNAPTVKVTFTVTKDAGMGNSVYLVGNFCSWSPANENAIKFTWSEGNVWTAADVDVEVGTEYHCKLVLAATENPTSVVAWEKDGEGNERVATFTVAATINLEWGNY